MISSHHQSSPTSLPGRTGSPIRSIAKLNRWLTQKSAPWAAEHIDFLRALQAVRSKGSAHSKSRDYEKLWRKLGFEGRPLSDVLDEFLGKGARMLDGLREWVEGNAMPQEPTS